MSKLDYPPEFESQVRKAMDVPEPNANTMDVLREQFVARGMTTLKADLQVDPASNPFRPEKDSTMKQKISRLSPRLAWGLAILVLSALLTLAFSSQKMVNALRRLFGYVPGVGLVENVGNMRMLAEPVSVTRDGVTLTITSAFVYTDHVKLIYDVKGIDPSNDGSQPQSATEDMKAFCGPQSSFDGTYLSDGDAVLRLPDGTIVKRMFGNEYPQNTFAMKPVYKTSIPSDVNELTMSLKCIPWARLGAVPENWEVPFKLVAVPAWQVIGEPVVDVNVTSEPVATETIATESAVPAFSTVKVNLERVVALDDGYLFYISLNVDDPDSALLSVMPANVYVIDSLGQKIQLITYDPMHPVDHPVGSAFEYKTVSKPADGNLNLVVEDIIAHFDPPWVYPTPAQAIPIGVSFVFDAGTDPQHNQTWTMNNEFEIAGYPLRVTSARAVTYADISKPEWALGSQGFDYGYQIDVEMGNTSKANIQMDIVTDTYLYSCVPMNDYTFVPGSSSTQFNILCRDEFPKGRIAVAVRELSVLIDGEWKVNWIP